MMSGTRLRGARAQVVAAVALSGARMTGPRLLLAPSDGGGPALSPDLPAGCKREQMGRHPDPRITMPPPPLPPPRSSQWPKTPFQGAQGPRPKAAYFDL